MRYLFSGLALGLLLSAVSAAGAEPPLHQGQPESLHVHLRDRNSLKMRDQLEKLHIRSFDPEVSSQSVISVKFDDFAHVELENGQVRGITRFDTAGESMFDATTEHVLDQLRDKGSWRRRSPEFPEETLMNAWMSAEDGLGQQLPNPASYFRFDVTSGDMREVCQLLNSLTIVEVAEPLGRYVMPPARDARTPFEIASNDFRPVANSTVAGILPFAASFGVLNAWDFGVTGRGVNMGIIVGGRPPVNVLDIPPITAVGNLTISPSDHGILNFVYAGAPADDNYGQTGLTFNSKFFGASGIKVVNSPVADPDLPHAMEALAQAVGPYGIISVPGLTILQLNLANNGTAAGTWVGLPADYLPEAFDVVQRYSSGTNHRIFFLTCGDRDGDTNATDGLDLSKIPYAFYPNQHSGAVYVWGGFKPNHGGNHPSIKQVGPVGHYGAWYTNSTIIGSVAALVQSAVKNLYVSDTVGGTGAPDAGGLDAGYFGRAALPLGNAWDAIEYVLHNLTPFDPVLRVMTDLPEAKTIAYGSVFKPTVPAKTDTATDYVFTVYNDGNANLHLKNFTLTPLDYSCDTTNGQKVCPVDFLGAVAGQLPSFSLLPLEGKEIKLHFYASHAGDYTARLSFLTDDPRLPQAAGTSTSDSRIFTANVVLHADGPSTPKVRVQSIQDVEYHSPASLLFGTVIKCLEGTITGPSGIFGGDVDQAYCLGEFRYVTRILKVFNDSSSADLKVSSYLETSNPFSTVIPTEIVASSNLVSRTNDQLVLGKNGWVYLAVKLDRKANPGPYSASLSFNTDDPHVPTFQYNVNANVIAAPPLNAFPPLLMTNSEGTTWYVSSALIDLHPFQVHDLATLLQQRHVLMKAQLHTVVVNITDISETLGNLTGLDVKKFLKFDFINKVINLNETVAAIPAKLQEINDASTGFLDQLFKVDAEAQDTHEKETLFLRYSGRAFGVGPNGIHGVDFGGTASGTGNKSATAGTNVPIGQTQYIGKTQPGAPITAEFHVNNRTTQPIYVSNVGVTGSDAFDVRFSSRSIAPNSSATLSVTFQSAIKGNYRAGIGYNVDTSPPTQQDKFFTFDVSADVCDAGGGNCAPSPTPSIQFSATPTFLNAGESTTLNWAVTNATTISIQPNIGNVGATGSRTIPLSQKTDFVLTATNGSDATTTTTRTVTVDVAGNGPAGSPSISSFAASPRSIGTGESSTLSWNVSGATSLSISPGGTVTGTSLSVTPTQTTTYVLSATNASGTSRRSATVTVGTGLPDIVSFTADPLNLAAPGDPTTLTWQVSNAASVDLSPGIGSVSLTGSRTLSPSTSTLYTLRATNATGSVTKTVTVLVAGTVAAGVPPVINSFTASAGTTAAGQPVTLDWSVDGADLVLLVPPLASPVSSNGSLSVQPQSTTTYTLFARNSAGSVTSDVTVTVTGGPAVPQIQEFTAVPSPVQAGGGAELRWTTNGTSASLSPDIGKVNPSGVKSITPYRDTLYVLTATNSAGSASKAVVVKTVNPDPAPLTKPVELLRGTDVQSGIRLENLGTSALYDGLQGYVAGSIPLLVVNRSGSTIKINHADLSSGSGTSIFSISAPLEGVTLINDQSIPLALRWSTPISPRPYAITFNVWLSDGTLVSHNFTITIPEWKQENLNQVVSADQANQIITYNLPTNPLTYPPSGGLQLGLPNANEVASRVMRVLNKTNNPVTLASAWCQSNDFAIRPIGTAQFGGPIPAQGYIELRVSASDRYRGASDRCVVQTQMPGDAFNEGSFINFLVSAAGVVDEPAPALLDASIHGLRDFTNDPTSSPYVMPKVRPNQTMTIELQMRNGAQSANISDLHLAGPIEISGQSFKVAKGWYAGSYTYGDLLTVHGNWGDRAYCQIRFQGRPSPGTYTAIVKIPMWAGSRTSPPYEWTHTYEVHLQIEVSRHKIAVQQGDAEIENGAGFDADKPTAFTVANTSDTPVNLSNLAVPPHYRIASLLPPSLAPGQSGTFVIEQVQAAEAAGPHYVSFSLNDADEPIFQFRENHQPIAASDGALLVGSDQSLTLDVTANDTDPDGDPVFLADVPIITTPAKGTVTVTDDGLVVYTPNAGADGNDRFTYEVVDGQGGSARADVLISIGAANRNPVATPDFVHARPGVPVTIDVTGNDVDPDGDAVSLISDPVVIAPANGVAARVDDANIVYTPNAGYSGTDTFTYEIGDHFGKRARGLVTIDTQNGKPVAVGDFADTSLGHSVTVDVIANDSDPDGDPIVLIASPIVDGPSFGTAVKVDGSHITYTPAAGHAGTDAFTYEIGDTFGGRARATVIVNIANAKPVAVDDRASTQSGRAVTVNVTANDSDPDGDTVTLITNPIIIAPSGGTAVRAGDATITYTPNAGFTGTDTFTYEIGDGNGARGRAVVTMTVTQSGPPVARNDQATTKRDTPVTIDLVANDHDPDGQAITLTASPITTAPRNGTVIRLSNSSVKYTPNSLYAGNDIFEYEISDASGNRDRAWVAVHVGRTTSLPIAVDDNATTSANQSITINVLANDSSPDGDAIALTAAPILLRPAHGQALRVSGSTISYTPNSGYTGTDTFGYEISDSEYGTAAAFVTVTVTDSNRPPVAASDTAVTTAGQPVTIAVTANDSDPDGDVVSLISNPIVTAPAHGTALRVSSSSIAYTPAAGFIGTDSFQYTIGDGRGLRVNGTVTVTVSDTNRPPEAVDDDAVTPAGAAVTVNVLANDSDPDGDHPVLIGSPIITPPANGTAVKISGTSITYTPRSGFSGTDRFQYEIGDGNAGRSRAWVNVTVGTAAVNNNPVAVDDDVTAHVDTAIDVNVIANDSDPDGDTVSLITSPVITAPAHGTASVISNSTLRYTPAAGFVGVDTLEYEIGDGRGKRARGWMHITVTDANSRPVAVDDVVATRPGHLINVNVTRNDYDPDGDTVVLIGAPIVTAPASGTATRVDNSTISYTPNAGFSGTDRFQYEIGDGHGSRSRAWVNVTVSASALVSQAVSDILLQAGNDMAETKSDTAVPIVVLANDLSFDGKPVALTTNPIITAPLSGTAARSGDTKITYTPGPAFRGNDRFEYEVVDSAGTAMRAWVTVQVPGDNKLPTPVNDDVNVSPQGSTVILPLANDSDADGDTLVLTRRAVTVLPGGGTIHRDNDRQLTYSPSAGFGGTDSFTYEVTDGRGAVAEAIVTLHVAARRPPVANPDVLSAFSGQPATINVLANDSDPDGGPLKVIASQPPQYGTLVWNSVDGTVTYVSGGAYSGPDSFTYTISDSDGLTAQSQVTVTVTKINHAPVGVNDTAETHTRTPVLIGVLANDWDVDYPTKLTVTAVTTPAHGTVVNNGQSITYTPSSNYAGSDSFTYTLSDGTATATASVAITIPNQAPLPHADVLSAMEDVPVGYTALNLLSNDTDADGDDLHVISIEQPLNGTITASPDFTQFSYQSKANWSGTDSFYYTVGDPFGAQVRLQSQIAVAPVNDSPVAAADTFSVYKNQLLTITPAQLLANDSDVEGDTLHIDSAGTAVNGAVQKLADGTITYQPYGEFTGSDGFDYTIKDSNGAFATGRVTVNVLQDTVPVAAFSVTCTDQLCAFDASASSDDRGIATYEWKFGNTITGAGKTPAYTYPAIGTYTVQLTVTDALGQKGNVSKTITVTCALPTITTHPTSRTITTGQPTTLSVTASKASSYQWYLGSAPSTANPVGTNSASLTVSPVVASSYWVNVINGCGSTPSTTATVSVCNAPSITTQPAAQTITKGNPVTLTVTAGGSGPFTYQWYEGAYGVTTAPVGTNSSSFTASPAASTSYWVKVTSGCNGGVASSGAAAVTVVVPPFVRRQLIGAAAGSQSSINGSWGQPTQAGNLLVAVISASDINQAVGSITAPAGWQLAANYDWNNVKLSIYYYPNNPGGRSTETFTLTRFPDSTLQLAEYTGAMTVTPLDKTVFNGGSSAAGGTISTGNTAATVQAKELVVSALAMFAPTAFSAPTNSFVKIDERQAGNNLTTAMFERITSAAGAYGHSASVGGSTQWLGLAVTFKSTDTGN